MAEGDGAWVVLGRKSDRFQSPSGDPERPQGVPEAGRGVILSFVFVFFENGARTSGCLHKCNQSKRKPRFSKFLEAF